MEPALPSLRRLSSEIARFRSGDVQAALARAHREPSAAAGALLGRMPPLSPPSLPPPAPPPPPPPDAPPPDAPPAELHATVLALRAALDTAATERDDARAEAARARAARAEAEDARAQAERARRLAQDAHDADRAASDALVERLSRERRVLAEDSAQKSALLLQRRAGVAENMSPGGPGQGLSASPASGAASSPHTPLAATSGGLTGGAGGAALERLRRELEAAKAEARADAEAHKQERAAREVRMAELERLVAEMRAVRADSDAGKVATAREQSTREAALRAELVSAKAQLSARMQELQRVRAERASAKSKLLAVESRARNADVANEEISALKEQLAALQMNTIKNDTSSVTIATLKQEIAQMSLWIRAISPSGSNLEQGLAILRAAATDRAGDPLAANAGSPQPFQAAAAVATLNESQQHRIALGRLHTRIAELSVQVANTDKERIRISAERDELKRIYGRCKRMRQLLERKSKHLQLTVDEIEKGIEAGDDDAAHAVIRAQEHAKIATEQAQSYKLTAEDYELSLRERDAEIRKLLSEAASYTRMDAGHTGDGTESVAGLRSQLIEAIREASGAAQARDAAEARLAIAERELFETKQQLSSLRQQLEPEIDYDPAELKVVRPKSGPLFSETLVQEFRDRVPKRRRVDQDVTGGDTSVHGPGKDLESRIRDLEDRNRELEQLSKLGERTKEIAKRKIEEVRQACYVLFGWTMRINGAKYTLSSIYAEDREDELEFGVIEAGGMALHENGYAIRIKDEVDQLITKWKSIPALLASVTLSNFEKTTLVTGQ